MPLQGPGFVTLQSRLISLIKYKVSSGEISERGIARQTGISQPQIHNLLKGARNLLPPTADLLMQVLGVTLSDLLTPAEIENLKRH